MACGDREAVLGHLSQQYSEVPVSHGLSADGTLLELLVSPEGTWTVLVSLPTGKTCLAAAGDMWEDLGPVNRTGARGRPASLKLSQ